MLRLLLLAASLSMIDAQGNTSADGCALCCSPGGSCGAAFKQQPGFCCGVLGQTPFCCPTSAICYQATADAYRCRPRGHVTPAGNSGYAYRSGGTSNAWWALWALLVPILCFAYLIFALCRTRSPSYTSYPAGNVAMVPMQSGSPCGPGGVATGYPQPAYHTAVPLYQPAMQTGGGGNAALAGGAGLLGGVLLGESLASRGGGWGGGYGGGWGGPWGGGGGGFGGGGWGGGGGDFAASTDMGTGMGDFAADT